MSGRRPVGKHLALSGEREDVGVFMGKKGGTLWQPTLC